MKFIAFAAAGHRDLGHQDHDQDDVHHGPPSSARSATGHVVGLHGRAVLRAHPKTGAAGEPAEVDPAAAEAKQGRILDTWMSRALARG